MAGDKELKSARTAVSNVNQMEQFFRIEPARERTTRGVVDGDS